MDMNEPYPGKPPTDDPRWRFRLETGVWELPGEVSQERKSCADGETDDSYDLALYLEASPEERLLMLDEAYDNATNERTRTFLEGQMMGLTIDMDEHPEWFQRGCLCALCRSYA